MTQNVYWSRASVSSRMPTLLPSSCALLGRFAIAARVHCYGNIAQMQNVIECLYTHYTWLLLLAGWLGFNSAFNKTYVISRCIVIGRIARTTYVGAAYRYRRSSVACQSVTIVSPAETIELIAIPFGL